ncbi:site-2 protease family protein, partial [Thermanaerothrix sp.]
MDFSFDLQRQDLIETYIRRIFYIEDVTLGSERTPYLIRYRGRLIAPDSASAYDTLNTQLKPLGLTPLFRSEEGRHTIYIIRGLPSARPSNPTINLIFFILTLLSVWFTGGVLSSEGELTGSASQIILQLLKNGWSFALSMMAILAAHEFGHYLMGRHHGVHVTLPYFLPLPFPISPFGTMGAFINMKEVPKNRRILMDIGIAGPLSGLIVAIPVLLIGLSLSRLEPLPAFPQPGALGQAQLEGNSILYLLLKFVVFGRLLPEPATYQGLPPLLYWLRYIFTGQPLPYGGVDVILHPVAWAGWGGLLITALNLIPAGQLDGGHILYTLFGRKR